MSGRHASCIPPADPRSIGGANAIVRAPISEGEQAAMTRYAVTPPAVTAVPMTDGRLFPVRRIFCVGRNYAEHTREMGGDPAREPPFFFSKPADALVTEGCVFS